MYIDRMLDPFMAINAFRDRYREKERRLKDRVSKKSSCLE